MDDCSLRGEQFLQDNQDKLSYEKQDSLGKNVTELRDGYEKLEVSSMGWLEEAKAELERMKRDRDEKVSSVIDGNL